MVCEFFQIVANIPQISKNPRVSGVAGQFKPALFRVRCGVLNPGTQPYVLRCNSASKVDIRSFQTLLVHRVAHVRGRLRETKEAGNSTLEDSSFHKQGSSYTRPVLGGCKVSACRRLPTRILKVDRKAFGYTFHSDGLNSTSVGGAHQENELDQDSRRLLTPSPDLGLYLPPTIPIAGAVDEI